LVSGRPPRPASEAEARALIDAAGAQGLTGLLHEAVRDDPDWPADARTALHARRRALLRRGSWQLDLAERSRHTLARRGLRALPMKGAALAERLYGSPADRPMADVDLLMLDDWDAARQALAAENLQPQERADHAWSWSDPDRGLILELHRGLTSCPRLHPVDADGLWARSVPGDGQVGRRPAPEDLLVQLALHAAFQHGLVLSLVQWLDLRRLLEREQLDPARVAASAAGARAEGALGLALAVATAVVGAPPQTWARVPARLAPWIEPRLARPLAFVAPAQPALARLRWELAAGRRRRLVADTLCPSTGAVSEARPVSRLAHGLTRGGRLAWRWLRPHAGSRV
jgi:hypothetical protein